jgi:TRAP-type C4-dicarboxylate transport system substrate-binding protein
MREFDQAIRTESGGRLGFKIYPGGVQGDEIDVLRKIKLGQLHSAGVTGNGLTTIAPKVRVLDSPFLFSSYDQVDSVYKTFNDEFTQAFKDNGYVNLGWAEVGFVYVYTNTPVHSPEDMKNIKMWMWEGDPIADAAFKALNVHPIPLAITDVLTSLQTNLINGVYSTPYAMIAFQWFSRVKYMLDIPLADAAGAVVILKKKFDELPPDLQGILMRNGQIYMHRLTVLSREDNRKAIETLKNNGVTIVEPSSSQSLSSYAEIGKNARRYLVGSLFTADLLDRIEKVVSSTHHTSGQPSK